ncbi:MAG: hypothetical protein ACT4ON_13550 [Bacteroidota bacterium]
MKVKLFILMLILFVNSSFGQKVQDRLISVEKRISVFSDSLLKLNKQLIELNEKWEWKGQILEERLKQASDTIANQNSLLDGFGVLYTIITIIITLIAVAVPILTYQFGVKPSQNAIKEFENNADKKFENYLSKTRNEQIEQAIENLKSQNQELKLNAINYLSLTQYQGFTDLQLYKLFVLLKSTDFDQTIEVNIAYIISNKKNDYATDYFTQIIKDGSKNISIKHAAIRYFTNIGIDNYLDLFKDLLAKSTDKQSEYFMLLAHVANANKKAVKRLLNAKELIDLLDMNDLKKSQEGILSNKNQWQISDEELEQSYLNKEFQRLSQL